MPSTMTSRLEGLTTSVALKAPCRVATTAAITLSGLQTIDGIALASGDRVLVKDQADASENGIYVAGSGAWVRAKDFNGSLDIVQGTQVRITSGTTNVRSGWEVSSANPLVIGTSDIGFVRITYSIVEGGSEVFTPEQYEAAGDGVANDDAPQKTMTSDLVTAGGGTIEFGAGKTYLYGVQASGGGYYRELLAPIHINDAAVPVTIRGNGATLKLASGLKFGSFDPGTGAVHTPSMPFTDDTYLAHLGYAVLIENAATVEIDGLNFDMNSSGQTVGGEWGNEGWQVNCYGLYLGEVASATIRNCHFQNSLLDHLHIAQTVADDEADGFPIEIINCTFVNAGRNCAGVGGGKNIRFSGCRFENAGSVPNATTVSTSPASCFDVEDEAGVIRDVVFEDCEFIAAATSNTCFVADSGDSARLTFIRCTFDGPVWTSKPGTVFRDCRIKGAFSKVLGGQSEQNDNTLLDGCTLDDAATNHAMSLISSAINGNAAGAGVRIRNSTFNLANKIVSFQGMALENVQINWSGGTNISGLVDLGSAIDLGGASGDWVTITEAIPLANRPATGYSVVTTTSTIRRITLSSPNGKLALHAATVGAGLGVRDTISMDTTNVIGVRFAKRGADDPEAPGSYGFARIFYGNAAPTSGDWVVGDVVINEVVATGQPMSWGCSVAGTPGTWVAGPNWA